MGHWNKTALRCVSETGTKTAYVADMNASDPADLRPLVTGKRVVRTRGTQAEQAEAERRIAAMFTAPKSQHGCGVI